uniref:Uncharacterized protein n=1 Tax=Salix viminalis TaxID=40686 RepID=A0A6N2M3I3_SALVM
MHLWPTMRIRDSFKSAYLKKLEWNLHRMNNEKKQRSQETSDSNQQRLLDDGDDNRTNQHQPAKTYKAVLTFLREIFMLVASTRTRNDAVSEGIKGSLEIVFQKVEQGLCSFLTRRSVPVSIGEAFINTIFCIIIMKL